MKIPTIKLTQYTYTYTHEDIQEACDYPKPETEFLELTFKELVKHLRYTGFTQVSQYPFSKGSLDHVWIDSEPSITSYRTGEMEHLSLHLQNEYQRRYFNLAIIAATQTKH
jgi:hypothetical protein